LKYTYLPETGQGKLSGSELSGFGANAPSVVGFTVYTYYTSAKGFFMDCSLLVEMTWPDSMNEIYIETFWLIAKQLEI
jgi:hypothetical protein